MKIAIVILNWNGKELLEKFLPSIIAHSPVELCDIYVADNASTDDSITFIKEQFPTIKIIQNSSNGGFAKGYNDALNQVDAPLYALVNSDIEVTEHWLEPILDYFKTHPNTAIIQPKILDYNNKEKFEYAGAGGGFIDSYGFAYCRGRIFNALEFDKNQYNDTTDIFWASGACLFIRSKVFHELNGFDENYFAHFEEIDLCWRAKNLNYTISYVGTSTVYHVGGATLKENNPRKTFLNFRNSLLTLTKNLPRKGLFKTLFLRLVFDGIAGVKFIFEFKPTHTFAIIKAHFSFYYHLRTSLKKRKEQPSKLVDFYKTKSIVWQFYVKNKKKFSDLI
ncbi:MAG: glycosyltransferase family 2 protein [Flavobacteriaceae bacterium]|nr:glycosyltransferase family 2 protein [Flavobacteriaceae bacterium]